MRLIQILTIILVRINTLRTHLKDDWDQMKGTENVLFINKSQSQQDKERVHEIKLHDPQTIENQCIWKDQVLLVDNKEIIGKTQDGICLKVQNGNYQQDQKIRKRQLNTCSVGFCSFNNQCVEMTSQSIYLIGKLDSSHECSQLNAALTYIDCSIDYCLESGQCKSVENQAIPFRQADGQCSLGGTSEIHAFCANNYCLQSNQTCIQITIGRNKADSKCVGINVPNVDMCGQGYCIQLNANKEQVCILMGSNGDNYAKQLNTSFCLNENKFYAVECISTHCLLEVNAGEYKCVKIGSKVDNIQTIGEYQNKYCTTTTSNSSLYQNSFKINTVISNSCVSTYCLAANKCVAIISTNRIGRGTDSGCLDVTGINAEYCRTGYCIDQNDQNKCKQLSDTFIGRHKSLYICQGAGVANSNQCGGNYCLNPITSQCVALNQSENRIGKDSSYYCVGNEIISTSIQYCMQGFCIQNGQQCLKLSNSISREQSTMACVTITAAQIEECGGDHCLDTDQKCYPIDGSVSLSGSKRISKNSKSKCQDEQISDSVYCQKGYCIDSTGKCQKLSNTFVGKEMDTFKCLPSSTAISIECYDTYCLEDNGECTKIDGSLTQDGTIYKIGKQYETQKCMDQQKQSNADYCMINYCIDSGQCKPLSNSNIGRDKTTTMCLNAGITNSSQCGGDYCLDQTDYICYKLDGSFVNGKNKIGKDANSFCLDDNQTTADKCMNQYCIITNKCQKMSDILIGKDSISHKCISQGTVNSIECGGQYCLETDNTCTKIDGTLTKDGSIYKIGKQKDTTICIDQKKNLNAIYCKVGFCIDTNKACQLLSNQYIGRDATTTNCIPAQTANSSECGGDYCLDQTDNKCYKIDGQVVNGKQLIGKDVNSFCLVENQATAYKCMSQYCIISGKCQKMSDTLIGKDSISHKCISQGIVNSIECGGQYCLEKDTTCTKIDGTLTNDGSIYKIGKQKDTTFCIDQQKQLNAIYCKAGFCIDTNKACQLLSNQYIGRDAMTTNCIPALTANSSECGGDYCLNTVDSTCYKIDGQVVNGKQLIGKDKNSKCLSENESFAVYCKSSYCINSNQCQQLSDIVVGKQINTHICINAGDPNSMECGGKYCLEPTNICTQIDGTLTSDKTINKFGKQVITTFCIDKEKQLNASYCKPGFCIDTTKSCQQLSDTYIGRDKDTTACQLAAAIANSSECGGNYCLDTNYASPSSYVCVLMNGQTVNGYKKIGKDIDSKCLADNQAIAYRCTTKYCIDSNKKCMPLSSTLVGKDQDNHNCLNAGDPNSFECGSSYCLDTNNKCVATDGTLTADGVIYKIGRQKKTFKCIDEQGLPDAEYCKVHYCIDTNSVCQKLSNNYIGRDKTNFKCTTTNSKECGGDYCLDTDFKCYLIDGSISSLTGSKRIGKDSSTNCLSENDVGAVYCAKNYCINTADTKCTKLSNTFVGKDASSMKCINQAVANSIECGGTYCLDTDTKCRNIDGSVNADGTINIIGKHSNTDQCLDQGIGTASYCMKGYCINTSNQCQQLTNALPGRNILNYQCLAVNTPTSTECGEDTCLQGTKCQNLDTKYTINNRLVRRSFDGQCSSSLTDAAEWCAQEYCLLGGVCRKLDSNYPGKLSDQTCSAPYNTNSIFCSSDYCLYQGICHLIDMNILKPGFKKMQRNRFTSVCEDSGNINADYCYGNYCIDSTQNYQCVQLNPPSFISKLSDHTCGGENQQVSLRCASSYCIDLDVCAKLDGLQDPFKSNVKRLTRDSQSHVCLEISNGSVDMCSSGYCIFKDYNGISYCRKLDNEYPSKDLTQACQKSNYVNVLECGGSYCLDANLTQCVLIDGSNNSSGIPKKAREKVTTLCRDSDVANVEYCIQGYCIDSSTKCIQMTTYNSKDFQHLCNAVGTPNSIYCTGNYCLDNDICVPLDETFSATLNLYRISRLKSTSICSNQTQNNVDKCSPKYCINALTQCYFMNNDFPGKNILDECKPASVTTGIVYCQGDYCLDNSKCIYMSDQNKYGPLLKTVISRNSSTSLCSDQNDTNIDRCSDTYCIDTSVNKCVLIVEAKKSDQTCQAKFLSNSIMCSVNLCLDGDECQEVDGLKNGSTLIQRIGREKTTSKCTNIPNNVSLIAAGFCILINKFVPVSSDNLNAVGTDNLFNCVKENDPNAIFCSEGYCINSSQKCIKIKAENNVFGRDSAQNCLLLNTPPISPNTIQTCLSGSYCKNESMNYCQKLDSTLVSRESITQKCAQETDTLTWEVETCFKQYCILETDKSNCKKMKKVANDLFAGREQNTMFCKGVQIGGMSECSQDDNTYCFYKPEYNCQLAGTSDIYAGRDSQFNCLQIYQVGAVYCAGENYCLYQSSCIKLSLSSTFFKGKERITSRCLLENIYDTEGAEYCSDQYCIDPNLPIQQRVCQKLDDTFIAKEKNTHFCLLEAQVSTEGIQNCLSHKYCLQINNPLIGSDDQCVQLQPNQCQGVDQTCKLSTSGDCLNCHSLSCLDVVSKNCYVVNDYFVNQQIPYCAVTTGQGECQDLRLNASNCSNCPYAYCLQNNVCKLTSVVAETSKFRCAKQDANDYSCLIFDINASSYETDENKKLCGDEYNTCKSFTEQMCYYCPQGYIHPGNRRCYKRSQGTTGTGSSNYPFGINTNTIISDCYDQNSCSTTKCQNNCSKCSTSDSCDECSEGYFLFKQVNGKRVCVLCPDGDLDIINQKNVSIFCADCFTKQDNWYFKEINSVISCQNYLIQHLDEQNTYQLTQNLNMGRSYKLIWQSGIYYVVSLLSQQGGGTVTCDLGCDLCYLDNLFIKRCQVCSQGYAIKYDKTCVQCSADIIGCADCYFGGKYLGQEMDWSTAMYQEQYSDLDFTIIDNTPQYYMKCKKCSQSDYTTDINNANCVQCKSNCAQCQLQYIQETKEYKYICSQCINGYVRLPQGEQCQIGINNCNVQSFKSTITNQSITLHFSYTKDNNNIKLYCHECNSGYYYNEVSSQCLSSCSSNCKKCGISSSNCLFCEDNIILLANKQCSLPTQYQKCDTIIENCIQCYQYITAASVIVYQCLQCKPGYTPTLYGCELCPTNCLSCLAKNDVINFQNAILYERQLLELEDRKIYMPNNSIKPSCLQCKDGYQIENGNCVFSCGSHCSECILVDKEYQCIKCDTEKYRTEFIDSLQYLENFYQRTISLEDLVQFSPDKKDCIFCPFSCDGCTYDTSTAINSSEIGSSSVSLETFTDIYNANCLKCKSILKDGNPLTVIEQSQSYEFYLDKERQSCVLCPQGEKSCIVTKEVVVYAKCDSSDNQRGSGEKDSPLNFSRIEDISWDDILTSGQDIKNIIFMNERNILEITLKVIFSQQVCVLNSDSIYIKSKFQTLIKKSKYITIEIVNVDANNNPSTLEIQTNNIINIIGFNKIILRNITIKSFSFHVKKFGLSIYHSTILKAEFYDFGFEYSPLPSNVDPTKTKNPNEAVFKVYNLKEGILFDGLQLVGVNKSEENLIDLIDEINLTKGTDGQPFYIKLNNLIMKNCNFTENQLILTSADPINIEISEVKSDSSLFSSFTLLRHIPSTKVLSSTSIASQVQVQVKDVEFKNTTIVDFSSIISTPSTQNPIQIDNISFINNCVIKNNTQGLFQLDQAIIKNFRIDQSEISLSLVILIDHSGTSLLKQLELEEIHMTNSKLNNVVFLKSSSLSRDQKLIIKLNKLQMQDITSVANSNNKVIQVSKANKLQANDIELISVENILFLDINEMDELEINKLKAINDKSKGLLTESIVNAKNLLTKLLFTESTFSNQITSSSILYFEQSTKVESTVDMKFTNLLFEENDLVLLEAREKLALVFVTSSNNINLTYQGGKVKNNIFKFDKEKALGDSGLGLFFQVYESIVLVENVKFIGNIIYQSYPTIYCISVDLTIKGCEFESLTISQQSVSTYSYGGFVYSKNKNIQIQSSSFTKGYSQTGGAIYLEPQKEAKVYIYDSQFTKNQVYLGISQSQGGAIYFENQSIESLDIQIIKSNFNSNVAYKGGALNLGYTNMFHTTKIEECTFLNNESLTDGQTILSSYQVNFDQNPIIKYTLNIVKSEFYLQNYQTSLQSKSKLSSLFLSGLDVFQIDHSNFYIESQILNIQDIQNLMIISSSFKKSKEIAIYGRNINNFDFKDSLISQNEYLILDLVSISIKMSNSQITNNSNILTSLKESEIITPFESISLISIKTEELLINSLEVIDNKNNQGEIIRIFNSEYNKKAYSQKIIQQSKFINNSLTALKLLNVEMEIRYCQFINNKGVKGGAIYYYLEDYNYYYANIISITYSLFQQNYAKIAGALYVWNNFVKENIYQTNSFENNSFLIFGKDYVTRPTELIIIDPTKQLQAPQNPYFTIDFTVEMMTEMKEQFKVELSLEYLQILLYLSIQNLNQTISSKDYKVSPNIVGFEDYQFNLKRMAVQMNGLQGTLANLALSSSMILVPIRDSNGILQNIKNDYILNQIVQMRNCLQGEELIQTENSLHYCRLCEWGTYSLIPGEACKMCNNLDLECFSKVIKLPPGYWRVDENTDNIIECKNRPSNCLGSLNKTENQNINFYCAEGHIGALCEDCDIHKLYWTTSFSQAGNYQCSKCSTIDGILWKTILLFAGQVILAAITVKSSIQYSNTMIYFYYLKKIKMYTGGRSIELVAESSVYIKIFQNYIQIIAALKTFDISLPSGTIENFGSPVATSLYSLDCYIVLLDWLQLPYVYRRVIISQMQIMGQLFTLLILLVLQRFCTKMVSLKGILFCIINYILISNYPQVISLIISTMSCKQVGQLSYLKDFTQYLCDDQHNFYRQVFLIPLLIFWAFIIPIIQLIDLIRSRKQLENRILARYSLGFLYNEYKSARFYWEFVKLIEKLAIIIILNLYDQQVKTKGVMIQIVIIFYGYLSYKFKPYNRTDLNQIDLIQTIVCLVSIGIGILLYQSTDDFINWLGLVILVILNLLFLCFMIYRFTKIQLEQNKALLSKIKSYLVKHFKCFSRCIRLDYVSVFRTNLRWLWIRKVIVRKYRNNNVKQTRQSDDSEDEEYMLNNSLVKKNANLKESCSKNNLQETKPDHLNLSFMSSDSVEILKRSFLSKQKYKKQHIQIELEKIQRDDQNTPNEKINLGGKKNSKYSTQTLSPIVPSKITPTKRLTESESEIQRYSNFTPLNQKPKVFDFSQQNNFQAVSNFNSRKRSSGENDLFDDLQFEIQLTQQNNNDDLNSSIQLKQNLLDNPENKMKKILDLNDAHISKNKKLNPIIKKLLQGSQEPNMLDFINPVDKTEKLFNEAIKNEKIQKEKQVKKEELEQIGFLFDLGEGGLNSQNPVVMKKNNKTMLNNLRAQLKEIQAQTNYKLIQSEVERLEKDVLQHQKTFKHKNQRTIMIEFLYIQKKLQQLRQSIIIDSDSL